MDEKQKDRLAIASFAVAVIQTVIAILALLQDGYKSEGVTAPSPIDYPLWEKESNHEGQDTDSYAGSPGNQLHTADSTAGGLSHGR